MSMDPSKWTAFDQLSSKTQERIVVSYPYLKFDQSVFQDKESGVFMKQMNSVKIEKLLDPENMPGPPRHVATVVTPSSGRTKK